MGKWESELWPSSCLLYDYLIFRNEMFILDELCELLHPFFGICFIYSFWATMLFFPFIKKVTQNEKYCKIFHIAKIWQISSSLNLLFYEEWWYGTVHSNTEFPRAAKYDHSMIDMCCNTKRIHLLIWDDFSRQLAFLGQLL